jgi:hypothetical protein
MNRRQNRTLPRNNPSISKATSLTQAVDNFPECRTDDGGEGLPCQHRLRDVVRGYYNTRRINSNSDTAARLKTMIKTYTAANLQDAHILLGLLHAEGINARILNASAQGGLGEIPFACTYPEIWLENARDTVRAKAVIEQFERPSSTGLPLTCKRCGEDSPPGFELCWNCGAATVAE